MEKITIEGREISFEKDINNMLLKEFKEYFNTIHDNSIENIDKQTMQIALLTGISFEDLEEMDTEDYKLIRDAAFKRLEIDVQLDVFKTFETKDTTYSIKTKEDGSIKITTKDLKIIRDKLKFIENPTEKECIGLIDLIAALVFKPVIDGDVITTSTDEELAQRAAIFNEEMQLKYIYPYFTVLAEKIK